MNKNPSLIPRKKAPELTETQINRMVEVLFYVIVNSTETHPKASAAPYGTSTPKVLASILKGVNPEAIDYAYRSMVVQPPTTREQVVAIKYFEVSAKRAPWTPVTFYKSWNKWFEEGCPVAEPVLSELQINEVKKFIKFLVAVFHGKSGLFLGLDIKW